MPSIVSAVTGTPKSAYANEEILRYGGQWLEQNKALSMLFERFLGSSHTRQRYFCIHPSKLLELGSLSERAALFSEYGVPLAQEVLLESLGASGIGAAEIGSYIFTSCTIPLIPSLDALLVEASGMSRDVKRLPVYQHGCCAGIVGLATACNMAQFGRPVVLTSLELCSLVFQPGDMTMGHLVGSAIFGDGTASVVVSPEDRGFTYVDSMSWLVPGSRHLMGYDLLDDGPHLRLDKELPYELEKVAPGVVADFLERIGWEASEVQHWLIHPGGSKILNMLEQGLNLSREQTHYAWDVLEECGNMSSATILFVLSRHLEKSDLKPGDKTVVLGIGPGITIELVAFESRP
ncbi:MAG: 3-oxoacyl-[acyl-carrier-protein] synthase III C-terminal domain-containing protein [bacterium]|nr:3-oxoacyl-[acyl-carrier-protein] synthase III C-terminal domain-containing protein [bacterium]